MNKACWTRRDILKRTAAIPGRFSVIAMLAALIVPAARVFPAPNPSEACEELRPKAIQTLRGVLDQEQQWIKVHAAEFLIALDYPQGVKETFLAERTAHENEPKYRIGVWRVLARTSFDEKQSAQWSDKIRRVFLDRAAPDRLHALESMAKLGCKIRDEESPLVEEAAKMESGPMPPFAAWMLVNSGRKQGEARLAELLDSNDAKTRGISAYALRHLRTVPLPLRDRLLELARAEPLGSEARVHLVCAASVHAPPAIRPEFTESLIRYAREGTAGERFQACDTLAGLATGGELPMLAGFLSDSDADVRASAAWAVLRVGRRLKHGLGVLDWIVILVYGLGILAVGWYYWLRTKTAEEYLLGGRKMRPLAVGLSFFAALFSTISYLAWPGEMIKYGPMILSVVVAYPLVAIVAGWFMIPFIMKLRITSAYEILETRFGLSVRVLGSALFLLLRLLWMAVIIYATVSKVLVPLLALDPSATPYLCIAMGLVPLVYTAMGGLRAAVVIDVLKSVILFAGAIITIVAVTINLGSVGAWWPAAWPAHWPEPNFGYDPTARVTFWGAVIAVFVWYICTSGSDQVAIQRYLATRDAKAARRVLNTSLVTTAAVLLLLAVLGLALLAYFQANPHQLPDGQRIVGDADQLFTRFIIVGLPPGVSGLLVAGLLAAAMSSLSAGINSTCSVVTVDFIDRFHHSAVHSDSRQVKQAKYISVVIGALVVALSSCIGLVQGNLLEIAYKVVNPLAAPLFGLFFMAMFVRWATTPGTLVGAAVGIVVVAAISYWQEITGTKGISFLWAMPLSLVAQIVVGAVVSLVPIGRRASPQE